MRGAKTNLYNQNILRNRLRVNLLIKLILLHKIERYKL